MKILIFVVSLLVSFNAFAWYPYGPMPYYGYGYTPYMYNAMGYGWGIQAPSFNYQTIVQQSPPIIINNPPPVYRERVIDNNVVQENERLRRYFGK